MLRIEQVQPSAMRASAAAWRRSLARKAVPSRPRMSARPAEGSGTQVTSSPQRHRAAGAGRGLAALDERRQPGRAGRRAPLGQHLRPPSRRTTTAQAAPATRWARSQSESSSSSVAGRPDELGGRLHRVEPGVDQRRRPRPADLLDVDAVDLVDLLAPAGRPGSAWGRYDDDVVDGPAGAPFEDLDADHVALHRADAAGHRAQRAGPVGQPQSDDDGGGLVGRNGEATCRRGYGLSC